MSPGYHACLDPAPSQVVHAEELSQMSEKGHPALWTPTAEGAAETNVGKFMEKLEVRLLPSCQRPC